ncbi:TPA: type II toxin-antitoxin system PemK/MazF family toxin [Campylobacter jejuni]|nr:type II toxin-antitoxin system PemK/MazF family toxin [Campylobacter jejuni]HDZ5084677.1 type II toxin-antitoxin system PemK/MazF family toxin [Campylobacter jejuni]HDZ5097602.1 type II toxin-antitoxin system PemK/MazF family toxin [Campylobacter jejuni]
MQNEDLRFDEWNKVKKSIQNNNIKRNLYTKKIYWIKIGKNIGNEVFGKGKDFARPVLVIKTFYNGLFLGVPLSSKTHNKSGKMYHKFKDDKNNLQVALLGQVKIFDSRRIKTLFSKINNEDFNIIKNKLKDMID